MSNNYLSFHIKFYLFEYCISGFNGKKLYVCILVKCKVGANICGFEK